MKDRYEEALKIAKDNFEAIDSYGKDAKFSAKTLKNTFIKMFPELAEPEKDDKYKIDSIIETIRIRKFEHPQLAPIYDRDIDWLESLKYRLQPKQELNKEDRAHIDSLLKRLEGLCKNEFVKTRFAINEDEDWLKSLKSLPNKQELMNGEDYGIDGLWHAIAILEKTLGKVEGYQSDDGILEHKVAIDTLKTLYNKKH